MFELSKEEESMLASPGKSVPHIFYSRARSTPEDVALHEVRLKREGLVAKPITYGAILERARYAAQQLADLGVGRGDRVLLLIQQPSCFLAYFFGAMGLGAVPVPLPSAGKLGIPGAFRARIESVGRDCSPRAIVAENAHRYTRDGFDDEVGAAWLEADACAGEISGLAGFSEPLDFERPLDEIAYLQYTSGSTGNPQGVIITHRNLYSNLRACVVGARVTRADRCLSWLPLYHDMGLIAGPFIGVFMNVPPYLMEPTTFVTSPLSWLKAIGEFGATLTVAPNFAYSILAHKIPDSALEGLDLSSLRLAFNGGEPIDHETVTLFLDRFEPVGFSRNAFFPVYGLAEATLAVTFPDPEDEIVYDRVDRTELGKSGRAKPVSETYGDGVTFVGVGRAVPDHEVMIRELEGGAPCPDRRVGEIFVRGPSVSPGYFGDQRALEKLVHSPEGKEVATGDLGYLVEGELFVVDRLKDIIIIAGRNYAPSDIERQVSKIEGLRRGAVVAFGLEGPFGTQGLHLVAEFDPKSIRSLAQVEREVHRTVRSSFSISLDGLELVPPGSIPKTSSGKIQRHRARQMAASGEFASMHEMSVRVAAAGRSLSKQFKRWIGGRPR